MESSKVLGGTEQCSSSESGWTTYIASSIHEDNNCDEDDENNDDNHRTNKKGDDDEEDDDNKSSSSMTSDASSGPSHPELPWGRNEGSHVMDHFKHVEDEDHIKRSSGKKPYKQLGKKTYKKVEKKIYGRRIKAEKEEPGLSTGYAHSGAKVTKTY